MAAQVISAVLAPGDAGLYQVTIQLPSNVPTGAVPMQALETVIDDIMPRPRRVGDAEYDDPRRGFELETALASGVSGYIRFLDARRLVALAKSYRVKNRCLAPPRPLRPGRRAADEAFEG